MGQAVCILICRMVALVVVFVGVGITVNYWLGAAAAAQAWLLMPEVST